MTEIYPDEKTIHDALGGFQDYEVNGSRSGVHFGRRSNAYLAANFATRQAVEDGRLQGPIGMYSQELSGFIAKILEMSDGIKNEEY